MKKFSILLFLTALLLCNVCAQNSDLLPSNLRVNEGVIVSIEDIDISILQIDLSDFHNKFITTITLDHILCIAVNECEFDLAVALMNKGAKSTSLCENDDLIVNSVFCQADPIKIADFLLKNGANINSTDSEGSSLLSYAIMVNNIDLVDFLIKNKVNKTLKATNTSMGCFPIHACESLEMLVKLESEGFDLNLVCDNGMNLLHFSIRENFDDISSYLITNKLVNKFQPDKDGLTPLDYAIKYKNQYIQKILKS